MTTMNGAYAAHLMASDAAGLANGQWNANYVNALRMLGYWLVPWPEKAQRPPDSLDAPRPVPAEEWGWHIPSVVMPLPSLKPLRDK